MTHLKRILAGLLLALVATVAAAQQEYTVRPGDTLTIEVLEDTALNRSVVVLPDGRFSFPFAGSLRAAGLTVGQIEDNITAAIQPNFAVAPNVFVTARPGASEAFAAEQSTGPTIEIYFLGEVAAPGLVEVPPGTTFLQALAQSGGPTAFAATKRIQLRRTDPGTNVQRVYSINYRALSQGAALKNDIRLRDGDVILVPERRLFE
ncbi:polysaccharide export outer membrane protein [Rhodovulum sp. ES.010]|uniref:polysaccharide biosynthesis/export family protein n=1 Tax=Rhodovulum sp. ES.010 TaxID=1882821 RepID=UPI000926252F|nr:polysaccharide biosynthesis/export family protein [Rhodovulum sp. ES.010]SIO59779.1 polysaccharide export outer membrane protein [Rhodovulum sp. ES.010]